MTFNFFILHCQGSCTAKADRDLKDKEYLWLHITILKKNGFKCWKRSFSISEEMFLLRLCGWHQIRSVRHVFCLLEEWSEHKTVGRAMLAEQWQSCFLREKFQFAGLPGFVPCLHLLGGMAQLSLERVRGFVGRISHSLVRVLTGGVNVRILRLN